MDYGKYQILSLRVEIQPHEQDKYVTVFFTPEGSNFSLKKIFLRENLTRKIFAFAQTIESHQDNTALKRLAKAR